MVTHTRASLWCELRGADAPFDSGSLSDSIRPIREGERVLLSSSRFSKRRIAFLLMVLTVLAPVLLLAVLSALTPPPKNLGVTNGQLADCPDSPNCVLSQSTDPRHTISPIKYEGDPHEALRKLRELLVTMPGIQLVTTKETYLHAVATSPLFRFRDDVEFVVDPDASVIHCRSASRVGYSDIEANRQRLEAIRHAYSR